MPVLRGPRGPDAARDARAARADRAPDTPGWTVRVVPNLYPALRAPGGRRPLAASTSARSPSSTDEELDARRRGLASPRRAARRQRFPYVHAMVNEGRDAGASLPHSHSQLVWLREPPPAVRARATGNGCAICELLGSDELEVADGDGARAVCHPRGPRPLRAAARAATARGRRPASELGARSAPARETRSGACARVEGPLPLNAWLHDGRALAPRARCRG